MPAKKNDPYDHVSGESEAGCGCGYPPAVGGEDLKTFIPGVGLLITSWDGAESRIVTIEEMEK